MTMCVFLVASESTIIYSTEPLWSTMFAATVLNETIGILNSMMKELRYVCYKCNCVSIGWNTLAGALLIISACLWSSLGYLTISGFLSSLWYSFSEEFEEVIANIISNYNIAAANLLDNSINNS